MNSPVDLSLFTKLWELFVSWELFHYEVYVENFTNTFMQMCI
jgi:hypothetical protein